jgi:hypothetical protein
MNPSKPPYQTVVRLVKSIAWLPRTIAQVFRHRRLQLALDAREAERLDRIRNPSKYRGKDC